jgi:hypothetical protein
MQNPGRGLFPRLVAHVFDQRKARGASGVVDEDINTAKRGDRTVDKALNISLAGHVTRKERSSITRIHLGQGLITFFLAATIDGHRRTGGKQGLCQSPADTTRATSNCRYFPGQINQVLSPVFYRLLCLFRFRLPPSWSHGARVRVA